MLNWNNVGWECHAWTTADNVTIWKMRNRNHNLENIHQGIHIFLKNSACLETEINLKVSLIIDNKLYNVFKIHQKILSFSFGKCSYGIFKKAFPKLPFSFLYWVYLSYSSNLCSKSLSFKAISLRFKEIRSSSRCMCMAIYRSIPANCQKTSI